MDTQVEVEGQTEERTPLGELLARRQHDDHCCEACRKNIDDLLMMQVPVYNLFRPVIEAQASGTRLGLQDVLAMFGGGRKGRKAKAE